MAEEKKILLVIDSNSIIHRAFHALPPLNTSKGEMVNAVYGFLLMFFKAIKEFHPEYIAATFDLKGPTRRQEKFIPYKAKREKAPNELYDQIPRVQEFLRAFHVPIFGKEGYEADDCIGTIVRKAEQKQIYPPLQIIILSGDMDTLQLVDDQTKVFTSRKGLQDSVLYDEKAVQKRLEGLVPKQLMDYKGLRGDPSDNIPGVTGVGEKTATQLLTTFGSLDNLYQELEEKTEKAKTLKPRIAKLLLQYKDQALLSRELGTIDTNVPIDFALEDLEWKKADQEKIASLLRSYGFRTLEQKLPELWSVVLVEEKHEERIEEKIEKLYQDGVFSQQIYELEKKLIPVIKDMERSGIQIDAPYFLKLKKEITEEVAVLEKKIFELSGANFNINSPSQLSEILFQKLLLSPKGLHKTPGGVLSTASPELEKISSSHAVVREILHYRELAKLLNTYISPLPALADSQGRIHAHFNQLGTATGRLSSSDPNLQNIPMQGEWAGRIRRGFVAKKDFEFCAFDYSQMELRIASHIAKDLKMQQFFKEGKDIHQMTAAEVFGVSQEKVTKDMRFRAKALNFGVLYGMGARGFSQSAGISLEEAQDFIENYFVQFPKIAEYIETTKEFARTHGYVETLFGRKRYLPDVQSSTPHIRSSAERAAVNHPIQGTAADIVKMAMVKIHSLPFMGTSCKLLLQIHDELLFEISKDVYISLVPQIQTAMEETVQVAVKLEVGAKTGTNWETLERFEK